MDEKIIALTAMYQTMLGEVDFENLVKLNKILNLSEEDKKTATDQLNKINEKIKNLFETQAKFVKMVYSSYIKVGFKPTEAIQLAIENSPKISIEKLFN